MQAGAPAGRYRPDIDGLRAIAVLSVIAYHLDMPGVGSGYAGVDIFFVISGFLIGGIVLRERASGSFTYGAFYARRARRILPALCATMLAMLPIAWAVMTPHDLRYFGGGIFATLLFASNLWFYSRIDYFNPDSSLDPLLHTWSLGVEEQFYLLFPPMVALAARFGQRAVLSVLAIVGVVSFGLALGFSTARPSLAFYMLPARLWELMAGVLAAAVVQRTAGLPALVCSALALLGLTLVAAGVSVLPAVRGWPGITTIIPVAGAVLLVLFGGFSGPARALLASPPFRAVGLISYSAYLIHHPLITLLVLTDQPPESMAAKASVIALTLLLAGLSWALIEQPFRRPRPLPRWQRLGLGGMIACLTVFAVVGHVTKGYPSRLPPEAQAVLAFEESRSPTIKKCRFGREDADQWDPESSCVHNADARGPQIVIWGDSHVATTAYFIAEALPELQVREFSVRGCPPIPGMMNIDQLTHAPVEYAEGCADFNTAILDWLLANDEIRLVVLYAYWANYIERDDFDTGNGYVLPDVQYGVPVGDDGSIPESARQAYLQVQFATLVDRLAAAGKDVLVLYPLPIAARDMPEYVARRIWSEGTVPAVVSYPEAAFRDQTGNTRAVLDSASSGPRVHRLDLSGHFCSAGACRLFVDGVSYFFDTNHLSQAGAALIAPDVAKAVREIQKAKAP